MRLWIEVQHGPRSGAVDLPLEGGRIGRGPRVQVEIDHDSIAPQHARVFVRRGAIFLTPLAGRVSWVRTGGAIAAPVVLSPGHSIQLGEVVLSAVLEDSMPLGARAFGWVMDRAWPRTSEGRRYWSRPAEGELAELRFDPRDPAPRVRLEVRPEGVPLMDLGPPDEVPRAIRALIVAEAVGLARALHVRGRVHGELGNEAVVVGPRGEVRLRLGSAEHRPAGRAELERERDRVRQWQRDEDPLGEGATLALHREALLAPWLERHRPLARLGDVEAACRVAPVSLAWPG